MATPLQNSQAGNISKFEIFSKGGETADVSAGVVVCDYYESILDRSVRFTAVIVDTGGSDSGGKSSVSVLQELKLTGSEKVHITVEDTYGNRLVYAGDNALYILEIRNVMSSSESIIYTIDLVSRELIADRLESTTVQERFDGELSQSVSLILNEYLKTSKNINIDATANNVNYEGKGDSAMTVIMRMAVEGISQASKKTAGYLFFETYEGFNFRSIDNLFDDGEGDYKSYLYNSTTELAAGYDGKIVSFDASRAINVSQNLKAGSYGTKLKTFDTYTQMFNSIAQEVESDEQKVHGGFEFPKLYEDFINVFSSPVSRTITRRDHKGELPSGNVTEQIEKQTESNPVLEDVVAQSAMTYNKLFTLSLDIVIAGDYSIRAGQLVHCDFPEQSAKDETGVDKELSGLYIVCDVCTHLTPKHTFTKMHLIRDSYGRKPKNQESSGSGSVNSNWADTVGQGEVRYPANVVDHTQSSVGNVDLTPQYDDPDFNPNDYKLF